MAVLKEREEAEAADKKGKKQAKLEGMFIPAASKLKEFSREAALNAVTQFVVCDDQALSLPDKTVFRNCLVAMRPRTTKSQLLSSHEVEDHIKNEYVNVMKDFKTRITI